MTRRWFVLGFTENETSANIQTIAMSSLPERPEMSDDQNAPVMKVDASDGRVLRRQRNMAAVRAAVLELLQEGKQPSLASIADRAGVATRSVYRYFGDVDAAVRDAVESCRERAVEVFESEPGISASAPLAERLGMLVLRRLRLSRLVEPLDRIGGFDTFLGSLDLEVREAFAPELGSSDDELPLLLCAMFRLPSVRAMRDVFDNEDEAVASAMMRATSALLAA